jgi:O-antigen/teichoic acid export membrane protein
MFMAPTLATALLPVLTLPIYTRVLSREEYGVWGMATAIGASVSSVCGLGLLSGYERNYFAERDEVGRRRLLMTVWGFAAVLQLGGLLCASLIGRLVATPVFGAPHSWTLVSLAFGVASIGSLKQFFLVTLRNEGNARAFLRYSLDELALGTLLSLWAVIELEWGAAGLLLGPCVASAVVLVGLAREMFRQTPLAYDTARLRGVLDVSLPLAPRAAIGAIGGQLDRLVLGSVAPLSGVGVYTVAQRIAQVVFQFMTALQQIYQPQVYRMFFASAPPGEIGRFLLPWAFASSSIALVAVLFAAEGVFIVTGPQFHGAAAIIGILALNYGLMFFGKQPQLVFSKKGAQVSALSMVTVCVNATAVYWGATWAGGLGASVGTLVAGVLTGGVGLFLAQRVAPIGYPAGPTAIVFGVLPASLLFAVFLESRGLSAGASVALKALVLLAFLAYGGYIGLIRELWHSGSTPTRGQTVS